MNDLQEEMYAANHTQHGAQVRQGFNPLLIDPQWIWTSLAKQIST
jgi:hypothetical protein